MTSSKPPAMASKCSCCKRFFTIAGDSAHRVSAPDPHSDKIAAWCRACDPWADLTQPVPRPGVDPCTHLEVA